MLLHSVFIEKKSVFVQIQLSQLQVLFIVQQQQLPKNNVGNLNPSLQSSFLCQALDVKTMSVLYIYIFIVHVNLGYVRKAWSTATFYNFVYATVIIWVCVQGDLHVDELL